ncbi:MAG: hypothetical protein DLM54_04800 [Acidimicrobiales bacterium]|nr:MAG: hypothetical protein DLM54_04800 [Acidimicrobiales bacterium]
MLKRAFLVLALCATGWLLTAPIAGAQTTYPPTPVVTPVVVSQAPSVVVVQGAPASPRALVRTGWSAAVPLAALGAGAVLLGAFLTVLARRRNLAA